MRRKKWIEAIEDRRPNGGGMHVTLSPGWSFDGPGHASEFLTEVDAVLETRRRKLVYCFCGACLRALWKEADQLPSEGSKLAYAQAVVMFERGLTTCPPNHPAVADAAKQGKAILISKLKERER